MSKRQARRADSVGTRRRNLKLLTLLALLVCWASPAAGQDAPLIELAVGRTVYQGRILARSTRFCWLLDRDGTIHQVSLQKVTAFRRVSARFRGYSPAQLKARLQRELGTRFDVVGTRHYLVGAVRGAEAYARLLEGIYRELYLYFRTRGFELSEPEFPLIAIVFDSRDAFEQYCRRDGVEPAEGLVGYYLRSSNRIALYQTSNQTALRTLDRTTGAARSVFGLVRGVAASGERPRVRQPGARSEVGGWSGRAGLSQGRFEVGRGGPGVCTGSAGFRLTEDVRGTLVHEATHQFAFNTGLHSRIGQTPKWVVEGLATVLEPTAVARADNLRGPTPVNVERLVWFRHFLKTRRPEPFLAQFVQDDTLFGTHPLDAYSEAWALTYYLLQSRPRRYFRYLKGMAAREPLAAYPPAERLTDFTDAFGTNWRHLEADYLRFIQHLPSTGR